MKRMGSMNAVWLGVLAALSATSLVAAPLGTAITYQGRLTAGGGPANGFFDLRLALYDASTSGNQMGAKLTNAAVLVSNGLFTTTLDFGAGIFNGTTYWLEIGVRLSGSGNDFSLLLPRRTLTAAPYALYAPNAGTASTSAVANAVAPLSVTAAGVTNATLTADKIASGEVVKSLNGLKDAVTLAAGTNVILTPLGNTLTLAAHPGNDWHLGGNPGTSPGTDFLGTTDDRALELKVNGQRALRLEPNAFSPSLIGGVSGNFVTLGIEGATIAGGGTATLTNRVTASLGAIGGGGGNSATASRATVSGGEANTAGGSYASVGGGLLNKSTGSYSTVAGGEQNTAANTRDTVGGGLLNTASGVISTVAGGWTNTASGNAATIAGGAQSVASGVAASIGGGQANLAKASFSAIGGGFSQTIETGSDYGVIAGGRQNVIQTNTDYATIPGGYRASATNFGQMAYASGSFATAGDAQTSLYVLRNSTSGVTTNELFLDGSGQRMKIPYNGRWTFDALVIASFGPGATNSGARSWQIQGGIKNVAGTTSMVMTSPIVTGLGADPGTETWTAYAFADTANDALVIRVRGAVGTTLRWVATVRTVELIY